MNQRDSTIESAEKEYLESLFLEADDTVNFLGNKRKWKRERWVCETFLRALQLNFSPNDLEKPIYEPPDVLYKDARFEIFMVIDPGRKMHSDWKRERDRRKDAKCINELFQPYRPGKRKRLEAREVVELMKPTLCQKKETYEKNTINLGKIDILSYVNLKDYFLDLTTSFPDMTDLGKHGWRSFSIVSNNYCRVLFATSTAPNFLQGHVGKTITIVPT